jgi:hypothetical protein
MAAFSQGPSLRGQARYALLRLPVPLEQCAEAADQQFLSQEGIVRRVMALSIEHAVKFQEARHQILIVKHIRGEIARLIGPQQLKHIADAGLRQSSASARCRPFDPNAAPRD